MSDAFRSESQGHPESSLPDTRRQSIILRSICQAHCVGTPQADNKCLKHVAIGRLLPTKPSEIVHAHPPKGVQGR